MAQIEITDFSGGITDSPFSGDIRCAEVMDNFLINKDKTAETVPGVEIFSLTVPYVGANRISYLKKIAEGKFIAFSGRSAYLVTDGFVTDLKGPTGNYAFNVGNNDSTVSGDFFNGAFHATNDSRPYQIKIYIDENGTPQLRTAGLPKLAGTPTITSTAGSNNFVYAFVYSYTYKVGQVQFKDIGAPIYVAKTAMSASMSICCDSYTC